MGVARDVGLGGGRGETPLALYVPLQQQFSPALAALARHGEGRSIAADLRAAVEALDRIIPR